MFNAYRILYIPSGECIPNLFIRNIHAEEAIGRLIRTFALTNVILVREEFDIQIVPWNRFSIKDLENNSCGTIYEGLRQLVE